MRVDRSYCSNQIHGRKIIRSVLWYTIQTILPPEPMPRACKSAVPGKFSDYVGALLRR